MSKGRGEEGLVALEALEVARLVSRLEVAALPIAAVDLLALDQGLEVRYRREGCPVHLLGPRNPIAPDELEGRDLETREDLTPVAGARAEADRLALEDEDGGPAS